MMKNGDGSIMLGGNFRSAGIEKQVRNNGRMNGTKCRISWNICPNLNQIKNLRKCLNWAVLQKNNWQNIYISSCGRNIPPKELLTNTTEYWLRTAKYIWTQHFFIFLVVKHLKTIYPSLSFLLRFGLSHKVQIKFNRTWIIIWIFISSTRWCFYQRKDHMNLTRVVLNV